MNIDNSVIPNLTDNSFGVNDHVGCTAQCRALLTTAKPGTLVYNREFSATLTAHIKSYDKTN